MPVDPDARAKLFAGMLGQDRDICSLFSECALLPGQYTGGLGALIKDQLETAALTGLKVTAISPYYRHGYFTQEIGGDPLGQVESYPEYVPEDHGLVLTPYRVKVWYRDDWLHAQVWLYQVGPSVSWYLLDTKVPENTPERQLVTDRLYHGDRLGVEWLLGAGGVQLREQLGGWPGAWHLNEGHAMFALYDLLRRFMLKGLSLKQAIAAVQSWTVGTIHTPVPAGLTIRSREEMHTCLDDMAEECGVAFEDLYALGTSSSSDRFSMAGAVVQLSSPNGVSLLHQQVAQDMFAAPLFESGGVMNSVTNAVSHRWVSEEMAAMLRGHVGPDWAFGEQEQWRAGISDVSLQELRSVRHSLRSRLIGYVWNKTGVLLEERACILGFGRRVPTYKRLTLLMQHPEYFAWLLKQDTHPVRIVMAGKSHPDDAAGKSLITALLQFIRDHDLHDRIVFLPDWDVAQAAILTAGADVWLNNPVRPNEACGTSGIKALLNGSLNCSIRDGWWDEVFNEGIGWAPGGKQELSDRDAAFEMLQTLEHQVLPAFFETNQDGLQERWLGMVRQALLERGAWGLGARMMWDYLVRLYFPAAQYARVMGLSEILQANRVLADAHQG
jgi:starch phosphorylase